MPYISSAITRRTKAYYLITLALLVLIGAVYFLAPGRFLSHPEINASVTTPLVKPGPDTTYATLTFAGDIMGHQPQIDAAYDSKTKTYAYDSCFRYVRPYIESVDFALANLEVTLGGPPYTGYPQFSSPDALPDAAKRSGFDFLITANNHSQDRGRNGVERTLQVLDSLGIPHTGTFRDTLEREKEYPAIVNVNGIRIALLNYTYGTNGLVVQHPNIVNLIDTAVMHRDLDKAKEMKPDFIITTLHWGLEYKRIENGEQQRIAQFLADHGTDAVIGGHPHVVQPVRFIYPEDSSRVVPVVYSLGNFISNQRDRYKDGGLFVELRLRKVNGKTEWYDISYLPVWVHRKDSPLSYTLIPPMAWEKDSARFGLNSKEIYALKTFMNDTRTHLKGIKENSFYK
jgi:poly-gamma-glutamate synthesis protein (capsule biosynthesis protein)